MLLPRPTLIWAPGISDNARRRRCSICCLVTPARSPRGVRFSVSVALRTLGRGLPA